MRRVSRLEGGIGERTRSEKAETTVSTSRVATSSTWSGVASRAIASISASIGIERLPAGNIGAENL
jgi:hypothetical protein